MTRYYVQLPIPSANDGFKSFRDADEKAYTASYAFNIPAIVYEQTGRNPPEILCVWSANP